MLHYEEQGLWGTFSGLIGCSPWLLCIFVLVVYHTSWSTLTLLLQLYQVTRCLEFLNGVLRLCISYG